MTRAGTGKTYASAFAMRELGFKRVLFLVHRSTLAKQALTSFRKVFEDKKSMGIVGAGYSDYEADYIFAMVETLHKADNLRKFDPEEFDCIVLDECHHATASSYKKIIDYFKPEFLLGLTATPERMDNQDVFKLFDTNVPFELRLRDAITNDLVVPFHYYGIRDSLVDYGLAKDQERKTIAQLASVEHCAFIKDKIEERRGAGKLKALAFCRNITHARMMAEELSEYYHTAYLTGKNSVGERIRAYNDLQDDNQELEILCTVDILNEGVDIPGCNMVLFLRPTDSSTVFIQQLGRGLRKYNNKEFVTVLDFIGNSYKRSVQIAFAIGSLAENFVMEKHLMRSLVKDNFTALELAQYGVHIQFDSESQQEIINYIEQENFNSISYLKKDYENFKAYINSEFPPKHVDFLNNDCAPDIMRFMQVKIKGRKTGCYYSFLQGIGETRLPIFSEKQIDFIKYVSSLLPLVRPHEFMVIRCIMETQLTTAEIYEKMFLEIPKCTNDEVEHTLKFMLKKGALIQNEGILSLNVKFDEHFKEYIDDLLLYGMMQYEENYRYSEKFVLWHNYLSYGTGSIKAFERS